MNQSYLKKMKRWTQRNKHSVFSHYVVLLVFEATVNAGGIPDLCAF